MGQRDSIGAEMYEQPSLLATGTDGGAALQQLAAERLAAHRSRRRAVEAGHARSETDSRRLPAPQSAAARVREAVAARYQQSLTYREFLETEAAQTLEKAQAVTTSPALPEELQPWELSAAETPTVQAALRPVAMQTAIARPVKVPSAVATRPAPAEATAELFHEEVSADRAGFPPELRPEALKVRLYEELGSSANATVANGLAGRAEPPLVDHAHGAETAQEIAELDDEIEFRLAPEFDPHYIDGLPIQANIIEFPRQLVAPRKARPRLAEGPLRVEIEPQPQLRIFEVEPDLISQDPLPAGPDAAPEWQSLKLGAAESVTAPPPVDMLSTPLPLATAPVLKCVATLELRIMAACVDAIWIGVAFVLFAAIAVTCGGHALRGLSRPMLGVACGAAFGVLAMLYPLLFFTFSEATPGMIYAEIGLCTFDDENPSRAAMRRRLSATLLAAAPLGAGLLWMLVDGERLAWNDRMSRMYLRSY